MGYRWTKKSIENNTIIDGRENDIAINDYIDVFNNSVDRENLPELVINDPMIGTGQLTRIFVKNAINIDEGVCGQDLEFNSVPANHPAGNQIFGLRYKNSVNLRTGGMWIKAPNATFTGLDISEGMLSIEWNCNSYIPKYRTFYMKTGAANIVTPKYVQWQVRYNGSAVYESGPQFTSWNSVNIACAFPVAQGTGEITIHYKLPPLINDSDNQVVFYWFGGQITAINRSR
tara:strand:+ start:899 stop:1588 length:690 start_codon:yes stop_codon:yes gene_type:complete